MRTPYTRAEIVDILALVADRYLLEQIRKMKTDFISLEKRNKNQRKRG